MPAAVITNPTREARRMDALLQYNVLDTPREESFDRITRLARAFLGASIAQITMVDHDRQWFKSSQGLDASETPREFSFCAHAIEQDFPLLVPDAHLDARFRDNPLVTGEPRIRFYLGIPLRTPDGFNIGTLCTIDQAPRQPSPGQIATMYDLANMVIDEMELRRLATSDSLTGAMNRRAFTHEAEQAFDVARRYGRPFSCIMIDADHFKRVNDGHGHAAGDMVLRAIAATCRGVVRSVDLFGRLGGEEFAIALPETDLAAAAALAERLRLAIAGAGIEIADGRRLNVTVSLGVATQETRDDTVADLLARADAAMYEAKRAGRDRVVTA